MARAAESNRRAVEFVRVCGAAVAQKLGSGGVCFVWERDVSGVRQCLSYRRHCRLLHAALFFFVSRTRGGHRADRTKSAGVVTDTIKFTPHYRAPRRVYAPAAAKSGQ